MTETSLSLDLAQENTSSFGRLNYDRRGSGEPLVLLHGVGSRWQVFEPLLDILAREHEVISVDFPGHGASPMPPDSAPEGRASFSPKALAGGIAALMDDLGLPQGRAHLAGNSLGGWVSLELAKLGRARSVTCLSPAGLWPGNPPLYIGAVFFASYAATTALGPFAHFFASDSILRSPLIGQFFGRPWRLSAKEAVSNLEGFMSSPGIPRVLEDGANERFRGGRDIDINVPVTVAFGARENVLLAWQSQNRRELPAHTRFLNLPGCGHVPTYDDPRLVAKVILEGSSTRKPVKQGTHTGRDHRTVSVTRLGFSSP